MCRNDQNLWLFPQEKQNQVQRQCLNSSTSSGHTVQKSVTPLWLVWKAVQQTGSLMGGLEFLRTARKKKKQTTIAHCPEWCFSSHQSSPSSGEKSILCMTIWAAGHASSVKAEGSRQFLSCSRCNNKPYRGLGRCRQVNWIIGQWQRQGYFPSFFWEDVGRQRGAIWQENQEKWKGANWSPGTKWSCDKEVTREG